MEKWDWPDRNGDAGSNSSFYSGSSMEESQQDSAAAADTSDSTPPPAHSPRASTSSSSSSSLSSHTARQGSSSSMDVDVDEEDQSSKPEEKPDEDSQLQRDLLEIADQIERRTRTPYTSPVEFNLLEFDPVWTSTPTESQLESAPMGNTGVFVPIWLPPQIPPVDETDVESIVGECIGEVCFKVDIFSTLPPLQGRRDETVTGVVNDLVMKAELLAHLNQRSGEEGSMAVVDEILCGSHATRKAREALSVVVEEVAGVKETLYTKAPPALCTTEEEKRMHVGSLKHWDEHAYLEIRNISDTRPSPGGTRVSFGRGLFLKETAPTIPKGYIVAGYAGDLMLKRVWKEKRDQLSPTSLDRVQTYQQEFTAAVYNSKAERLEKRDSYVVNAEGENAFGFVANCSRHKHCHNVSMRHINGCDEQPPICVIVADRDILPGEQIIRQPYGGGYPKFVTCPNHKCTVGQSHQKPSFRPGPPFCLRSVNN